jgi:hypothetical protein
MFDGVDVPAVSERAGTNPTALIQAGNLEIGTFNAGSFFTGKIAQVAIYNAKVTQANIRATISQGLAGSETSLVSAFSFNNAITDLVIGTGNNLTANGSAVATNADSPFGLQADGTTAGTTDYAIITKTAFSTNTTLTVQVPEGNAIPTTGGVSAVSYSTQKVPYGFPSQRGKWQIMAKYKAQTNVTNTVTAQYAGRQLSIPIGEWIATIVGMNTVVVGTAGQTSQYGLSSATSSYSEDDMISYVTGDVASQAANGSYGLSKPLSLSTQTIYYLVNNVSNAAATSNLASPTVPDIIYTELAYV